ncbi:hypothetical protein ACQ4LE_010647 [Meloidogyne hapla]|uniref:G-patch domain-containing protein n=1 Tax=Meloidogyne hapla TaxID=6305 RepID=A0A1I8BUL7_MELHA
MELNSDSSKSSPRVPFVSGGVIKQEVKEETEAIEQDPNMYLFQAINNAFADQFAVKTEPTTANWVNESERGSVVIKMMENMGYEQGKGLGKNMQGILEPIRAVKNPGKLALGADASKDPNIFVTTKRGRQILVYLGFRYNKDYRKKNTTYWRCKKYKTKEKCSGRAKTVGNIVIVTKAHICIPTFKTTRRENDLVEITSVPSFSLEDDVNQTITGKKDWHYWKARQQRRNAFQGQQIPQNPGNITKKFTTEDNVKYSLINVGYSQKDVEEVWGAISVLAKHGIMGLGMGLGLVKRKAGKLNNESTSRS